MISLPWSPKLFPWLLMLMTIIWFTVLERPLVHQFKWYNVSALLLSLSRLSVCLWLNCCAVYQVGTSLICNMMNIVAMFPKSSHTENKNDYIKPAWPRQHWKRWSSDGVILMTDGRTHMTGSGWWITKREHASRCTKTNLGCGVEGDVKAHVGTDPQVNIRQTSVSKPVWRFCLSTSYQ